MRPIFGLILGFCFIALLSMATGCQSHIGGQTLPSAFYLENDVRYYAPGAKNPLQNETTKLKGEL